MVARTTTRKKGGITVLFDESDKRLIRRAALETDTRSASEFIRRAAVKAAQKALGAALKAAA